MDEDISASRKLDETSDMSCRQIAASDETVSSWSFEHKPDPLGPLPQWPYHSGRSPQSKRPDEPSLRAPAVPVTASNEDRYRLLFDKMVAGAAILEVTDYDKRGHIKDLRFLKVNDAFVQLSGVSRDLLMYGSLLQIYPQTEKFWFQQAGRIMKGEGGVCVEGYHKGLGMHLLVSGFRLDERRLGNTLIDISAQKRIEQATEEARRALEIQVRLRTNELLQVNEALRNEISAHENAQKALLDKSHQLEAHTLMLEETNTALRVLLRERKSERHDLEEKVACNINELILPLLRKLSDGNPSLRQKTLIEAIEKSLDRISSPLTRRAVINVARLTPMETQVAALTEQGKTTVQIASILGVAISSIDFHRHNIRRKFKLTNKRINLQSFLGSLD